MPERLTYIDAVQELCRTFQLTCRTWAVIFSFVRRTNFSARTREFYGAGENCWGNWNPYKVRPAPDAIPGCFETGTQSHEGMAGTAAAVDYFAWIGETLAQSYHAKNTKTLMGDEGLSMPQWTFLFDYETDLAIHLIRRLAAITGCKSSGHYCS